MKFEIWGCYGGLDWVRIFGSGVVGRNDKVVRKCCDVLRVEVDVVYFEYLYG